MRSERLLRGMHKVCSHDLPNQLVALQSLLQMLETDELTRLSPDGQEYVQRLQNVSRRTSVMARFLKEMDRLENYVGKPERMGLEMLGRELQGALKQQFADKEFTFDWHWGVASIVGDYRTFVQALMEVTISLVGKVGRTWNVRAESALEGNQIVIHFVLAAVEEVSHNSLRGTTECAATFSSEQHMEMTLAQEWFAISEATLDVSSQASGGSRFSILLPNR